MTDLTPDLQFLVGEPVNGIWFVMDYVEVHFNGSFLRCLQPPTVTRGSAAHAFPGDGSRDALCSLIGQELRTIRAADGDALVATFGDGAVLAMSLAHEGRVAAEALHFRNHETGEMQFW
jgi:hypothetical protein